MSWRRGGRSRYGDDEGPPPLYRAIKEGQLSTMKSLMEAGEEGATWDDESHEGVNYLIHAIKTLNIEIVDYILTQFPESCDYLRKKKFPNCYDHYDENLDDYKETMTPIFALRALGSRGGSPEVIKMIEWLVTKGGMPLEQQTDDRFDLLIHLAQRSHSLEFVRLILRLEKVVQEREAKETTEKTEEPTTAEPLALRPCENKTPVHVALFELAGSTLLPTRIKDKKDDQPLTERELRKIKLREEFPIGLQILKELLAYDTQNVLCNRYLDPPAPEKSETSKQEPIVVPEPLLHSLLWVQQELHYKFVAQVIEVLQIKYSHRINWNLQSGVMGTRLFHHAIYCPELFRKLILEHGVDVNTRTAYNETILHKLLETDELGCEQTLALCDLIREKGDLASMINVKDHEEFTPLMKVHRHHSLRVTQWLLDHGADVNVKGRYGETILHHRAKWAETTKEHRAAEDFELLLKRGADKDVSTPNDAIVDLKTPLHLVCSYHTVERGDKLEQIMMLIKYGARLDVPDQEGETPLMMVRRFLQFAENKGVQLWLKVALTKLENGDKEVCARYLEGYPKLSEEQRKDDNEIAKLLGLKLEDIHPW